MSKKSKMRSRVERRQAKQRRKASNTAKYERWRDEGINTKSDRAKKNDRKSRSTANKHRHLTPMCGNPGCKRCFPRTE